MDSEKLSLVCLRCALSGECEYLQCNPATGQIEVRESFLAIRFKLQLGSVFVSREILSPADKVHTISVDAKDSLKGRSWIVSLGIVHVVYGLSLSPGFRSTESQSVGCEDAIDAGPREKLIPTVPSFNFRSSTPSTPAASGIESDHYSGWRGVPRDLKDGHMCPHCSSPAYCVAACGAKTYFVLPSKGKKTSPLPDEASHISRCAIHVGTHCHPPRSSAPRHLVDLVQETVKEELVKSPSSPPSVVRKKATASLVDKIANSGLIIDMTEEEKYEVFRGISTVAHPDKMLNMIKCIKWSSSHLGELSEIAAMQKNTIYRTLQRSLFPGQGGKDSRCFVFKMGTKVFEVYKVAQEIQEWWKSNVIRLKLKEMQSWLYWWVLRIRQWGNFMREARNRSFIQRDTPVAVISQHAAPVASEHAAPTQNTPVVEVISSEDDMLEENIVFDSQLPRRDGEGNEAKSSPVVLLSDSDSDVIIRAPDVHLPRTAGHASTAELPPITQHGLPVSEVRVEKCTWAIRQTSTYGT
ncbi:hypothetical protein R1sor_022508 [Riccia sorocarpa]|uniref:Uncharacterized protein n=1 Tax=Riccia sorocarpa TaxID=122646 RepID=A0ABD3GN22_9MARC